MRRAKFPSLLLGLLLALSAGRAVADSFPGYTVDEMSGMAALIVEGEHLGQNRVKITRRLKDSPLLDPKATEIVVPKLDAHSRRLGSPWDKERREIETKRLVLFLEYDSGKSEWHALATIDAEGACGSCGLFWYDDSACYGYSQCMNPGPYALFAGPATDLRIPRSIAALREQVVRGLANFDAWQKTLAVKDPKEKARALARYLLPRTSPPGDAGSYRFDVRKEMGKLGKDAVAPLVEMIRQARDGENLDEAVLILYDLGATAREAAPLLCSMLGHPTQAHPEYVLSSLRTTGDPKSIPSIRPFLARENPGLARAAVLALAALGDRESLEKMADVLVRLRLADGSNGIAWGMEDELSRVAPGLSGPLLKRMYERFRERKLTVPPP